MMSIWSLVLSLLPIILIFCVMTVWKKPAHITGIIGWVFISLIAFFFFQTNVEVIWRSTLAGAIKSFPVAIMVAASLFQVALMEKTGALKRIVIFFKSISGNNRAVQIIMINIGFGTLLVSSGTTPVSILPPILLAMGYSTYQAIALPAVGYDSLCTYSLLGAAIVVFVDIANGSGMFAEALTLADVGGVFYPFLPVVSVLIALSMMWITGKGKAIKEGLLPTLVMGVVVAIVAYFCNRVENLVVLTGVFCGLSVAFSMMLYIKMQGFKVIDTSRLTEEERAFAKEYPLVKAISPLIILVVCIVILNVCKPIFNFFYYEWTNPISGLTANGKDINVRVFFQAYTWCAISSLLALPILKPSKKNLGGIVKTWSKRFWKPMFSTAIFFSIGEIMNMTGYSIAEGGYTVSSMVNVLATYSAEFFQELYGLIVGVIGMLAGFVTGSETSAIAFFGGYSMTTGTELGWSTTMLILVTAGLAFGAGLASVISPAKLQNAAASIDKIGEESKVMRTTAVIAVILVIVASIYIFLLLKLSNLFTNFNILSLIAVGIFLGAVAVVTIIVNMFKSKQRA